MAAKYVLCPAPGITVNGAHITHLPADLRAASTNFAIMRDRGLMCPVCEGNGMVLEGASRA